MFFKNVGWKSKIFDVKSAVMKSYLHVSVVLAIYAILMLISTIQKVT